MQNHQRLLPSLPFELTSPDRRRRYILQDTLGTGSFGAVYSAICQSFRPDGVNPLLEQVAVKLMERGKGNCRIGCRYVEDELVNHHSVSRHPHVISFKETFCTPDYLCLVMEYAGGGTLHDYVRSHPNHRLPERTARSFFQQLLLGVDYCHRRRVVIRDIKLENALLSTPLSQAPVPIIKLCDFGYSKSESARSQPNTKVGTLVYMAPEVIQRPEYDGYIADVWSLGVMLYIMLAGRYPYYGIPNNGAVTPNVAQLTEILRNMLRQINARALRLPADVTVAPACADLLYQMLDPEPNTRITLQAVMRHPWVAVGLPEQYYLFNDPRNEHNRELWEPDMRTPTGQTEADIKRVAAEAGAPSLEQMLLLHHQAGVDNMIDDPLAYLGGYGNQFGGGVPHNAPARRYQQQPQQQPRQRQPQLADQQAVAAAAAQRPALNAPRGAAAAAAAPQAPAAHHERALAAELSPTLRQRPAAAEPPAAATAWQQQAAFEELALAVMQQDAAAELSSGMWGPSLDMLVDACWPSAGAYEPPPAVLQPQAPSAGAAWGPPPWADDRGRRLDLDSLLVQGPVASWV